MSVSKSVAIVVKMVGGMNKAEKKECADLLGSMLGMKKGKGNSQPFWIKKIDGIDASQTGPYAIEGKWLRDTVSLEPGELCVIGIKYPAEDRRYSICTQDGGSSVSYNSGAVTLDFDNAREIETFTTFSDCLAKVKTLTPSVSKAA